MERTSRSAVSALSSWESTGIAASKAGAPCCASSSTACAMPYIFRLRSMMTRAPLAGSCRMARLPDLAQGIIAFNVGPGFVGQRQGLRGGDHRRSGGLAVDQPVEPIEDVGFGRHAILQRQFHRHQHGLLVMVKHQSQDLYHLPIATNTAQEVLLQSLEGLGQFQERGTVAQ